MKTGRRKAREEALQILYQQDLNTDLSVEEGFERFKAYFSSLGTTADLDTFTIRLVRGVISTLKEIDQSLAKASEHWRLERMAAVDRNVLRLGVFELYYCDDIPATVTINEMVELAKTYGSDDSPAFVNGLLDKLRLSLRAPGKAP